MIWSVSENGTRFSLKVISKLRALLAKSATNDILPHFFFDIFFVLLCNKRRYYMGFEIYCNKYLLDILFVLLRNKRRYYKFPNLF